MPAPAPAGECVTPWQQIDLPTGQLQLQVQYSRWPQDDLLGFGARDNLKRGFLFVSKVLGKHWPVTPGQMAALHRDCAQQIAPDLPGPLLFIALAETAIGFGQGVFEAFLQQRAELSALSALSELPELSDPPAAGALFLHSSRYRVGTGELIEFSEPHSHAPRQFLHVPHDPALQQRLRQARTLVLLDDEASTGNTFVNLAHALRPYCPHLAHVHIALITDFSGPGARLSERIGLPTTVAALLGGQYCFVVAPAAASAAESVAAPAAESGAKSGAESAAESATTATTIAPSPLPRAAPLAQRFDGSPNPAASRAFGRTGLAQALAMPAIPALAATLAGQIAPDETVLVLGTGEFMHPAFLLARALAGHGRKVWLQASTRSPILLWGAIAHRLCFEDNYGEGIANYLYNVAPGQYQHVLICHETPFGPGLQQLASQLNGRLFHFHSEDHIEEITVR
jgi:hypothetical protein